MKVFQLIILLSVASLVASSQTVQYEVYALRYASTAHPLPAAEWAANAPAKDSVSIDFMIWLIKGNNGKNILLDAGFLQDSEGAKEFELKYYARPDSVLAKIALQAGDITDIILSHPHWDHVDGINLFPNAHVWMQKEDYTYFTGGAWQKNGFPGGFTKRDVHWLVDLNITGRLTLVDGDKKEIIPGIIVYTGSRHTFNSQYMLVRTGSGNVILASDNVWIYYNLEHLAPPPPEAYGTFDASGYVKAMQRMKTMVPDKKYIIPGHDAKVFTKFPVITEGVIKIK